MKKNLVIGLFLVACSHDGIPTPSAPYQLGLIQTIAETSGGQQIAGAQDGGGFAISYNRLNSKVANIILMSPQGKVLAVPQQASYVQSLVSVYPNSYLTSGPDSNSWGTNISQVKNDGATGYSVVGLPLQNPVFASDSSARADAYISWNLVSVNWGMGADHIIQLAGLSNGKMNTQREIARWKYDHDGMYVVTPTSFAISGSVAVIGLMHQEVSDSDLSVSATELIVFELDDSFGRVDRITEVFGQSGNFDHVDQIKKIVSVGNGFVVLVESLFPASANRQVASSALLRLDKSGSVMSRTGVVHTDDIAWNGHNLMVIRANQISGDVTAHYLTLTQDGAVREEGQIVVEESGIHPQGNPRIAVTGNVFGVIYLARFSTNALHFVTITPTR